MTVIPQQPTLLAGTVRSCIDPTATHAEADVWQVLQQVGMAGVVQALPGGLAAAGAVPLLLPAPAAARLPVWRYRR